MTASGPAAASPYPSLPGQEGAQPPAVPPAEHGAPVPPPGPGVAPPFAAPPTEGRRTRLWLGLGAGALAVLICCGGGGAAVVGLAVSGVQAVEEQGRTVSTDYYQALVERKYGQAYDQLCDDAQRRESRREFERRVAAEPQVAAYRVGEVDPSNLTVPVDVTFTGGRQERQQVVLGQDRQTGGLEVCGVN
ncbi:Rv0361 family membrane protein [Micromonospora sp. LZ34]